VSFQGGKNRRRGKNENEDDKRELVFREDGQEYAQVIKMLGNGRLEALCFDGEKRLAHIRGKMRKKVCIVVALVFVMSDSSLFIRYGSIKATSFCSRCANSRTARQMS
jgi:initiation factor 1A